MLEPVIEHEPSHEGIKSQAQALEEVRNKYDTLVGFGSRDDLPSGRQPVRDFGGQIPGLP